MAKIKWTETLKGLKKGDIATLPLSAYSVISTTITRLKTDMCEEGANWVTFDKNWETKTFKVKRTA